MYLYIKRLGELWRHLFDFWPKIFAKNWITAFRVVLSFLCICTKMCKIWKCETFYCYNKALKLYFYEFFTKIIRGFFVWTGLSSEFFSNLLLKGVFMFFYVEHMLNPPVSNVAPQRIFLDHPFGLPVQKRVAAKKT